MGSDASVFVSYRRDDSKHAAGRLGERLGERFKLFMDIDSIRPGTDFTAVVRDAVDRADVVLAVIGKGWLSASSQTGARRLDEAHDWVSLEVGTALKHGTPVIPVLVDGARMPDRADLPESLTDLASRQAISLDHESFAADCSRLIETIEGLVGSQGAPDVDLWADPDYPAARSALLQGKWAKAAEGLERVLRRHPRHPQVQDQLAEAQRRQNLAELDERARDAAAEGRWGVAVEALEAIEALRPSADVAERLAEARRQQQVRSLQQDVRALAQLGDWAAVVAADAELTALDPRSRDFEGLASQARGHLLEARFDADYRRGLQQLDAGEWEAGEATFLSLFARRPDYRDTEQLLALARRRGLPEQPEPPAVEDTQPVAVAPPPVVEEPAAEVPPPAPPCGRGAAAEVPPPAPPVVQAPPPPPPSPPRETVRPEPDHPVERKPSRTVWIAAAVAAVVLVGAVITGVVLAGDDSDPVTGAGADPSADTSSASTTDVPEAAPPPASGSELVAVPELAADPSVGTIAMASRTSGVRVDHLADVDEFGTGADARSAPEGGRLRRLPPHRLELRRRPVQGLVVAQPARRRRRRESPAADTSGSYVVAVPAGAAAADLVMKADGVKQSLSLLTGQPGPDNLAVLARPDRSTKIGETFPLTETSTIPLVYADGVRRTECWSARDGGLGQARLLRRRAWSRSPSRRSWSSTRLHPAVHPATRIRLHQPRRCGSGATTARSTRSSTSRTTGRRRDGGLRGPRRRHRRDAAPRWAPTSAYPGTAQAYTVTLSTHQESRSTSLTGRSLNFGKSSCAIVPALHLYASCLPRWRRRRSLALGGRHGQEALSAARERSRWS